MAQSAKVLGIQKMARELREAQESAVIDAEVVEDVVPVSQVEAERIDKSARLLADSARGTFDRLLAKLDEGKAGDVWRTLGFSSWTAWIADVLGNQPLLTTDKAERRELVAMLHSEGMSGRAIAQAAHVSEGTVRNDLRSVMTRESEQRAQHRVERDAQVAEERAQDCAPARSKTTGLDGKVYSRPTPVPDLPAAKSPPKPPKPVAHAKFLADLAKHSATPLARVIEQFIDEVPEDGLDGSVTDEVEKNLIDVYADLQDQVRRLHLLLCGVGLDA